MQNSLNRRYSLVSTKPVAVDLERLDLVKSTGSVSFPRAVMPLVYEDNLALARLQLDRSLEMEPRDAVAYPIRSVLEFRKEQYASAMKDLGRCGVGVAKHHYRVKVVYDVVPYRRRYYLGCSWGLGDKVPGDWRVVGEFDTSRAMMQIGHGNIIRALFSSHSSTGAGGRPTAGIS